MLPSKNLFGSLACVAALCAAFGISSRAPVRGEGADGAKPKVQTLLEERRDVLKQRVEACERLVGNGRMSPEDVIAARDDLLNAELDLAVDRSQRIAVLERKLENAKRYEELFEARFMSGKGFKTEWLLATARRLEVEIELAREKQ